MMSAGEQEGQERPRKKGGRPLRYDAVIHPEAFRELRRDGHTMHEIAEAFGVHISVLYDWRDRFPLFKQAMKDGTDDLIGRVEQSLYKRALGYDYEETKVEGSTVKSDEGREVFVPQRLTRIKKHVPPDTAAAMCVLTNRAPDRWKHRQEFTHIVEERVPLVLIEEVEVDRDGQADSALPVPDESA